MSLDNLFKTGQLKRHATDRVEVGRLLGAAQRNLADARAGNIAEPLSESGRLFGLVRENLQDPKRLPIGIRQLLL